MFRWLAICLLLCGGAVFLITLSVGGSPKTLLWDPAFGKNEEPEQHLGGSSQASPDRAPPGFENVPYGTGGAQGIVVPDGRVQVVETQEVPSRRDGQLLFIATDYHGDKLPDDPEERRKIIQEKMGYLALEIPKGSVPPEQCLTFPGHPGLFRRWHEELPLPRGGDHVIVYTQPRYFKILQVGDRVKEGDLLALVDPTLALAELSAKASKFESTEAERIASEKTREEAKARYENYQKAVQAKPGSIADEDIRGALLNWQRYTQEEVAKRSAQAQSVQEMSAAHTTVRFHEIRATIPGVVREIYKHRGDAVKNLDPVLRIENPERLRVEALLDVQEARRIKVGMRAVVEASQLDAPQLELQGHLQEVTAVAVAAGPKPIVVSASEDHTVCGWDPVSGKMVWRVPHGARVRSVACTGPDARGRLMLSGCADGTAWLFDLDHMDKQPVQLAERGEGPEATTLAHRGAVLCVAFSPDGTLCATGGEDRSIALWDVSGGKLLNRVAAAHRAPVTSLQFTTAHPEKEAACTALVSAGGDQALIVWKVEADKPPTKVIEHTRRGGDVAQLGTDGRRVLFDQGKELRLLGRDDRQIEGTLRNTTGGSGFTTMALFSPDGKTILTNSAADNRLQLWRTPEPGGRGAELRQFVWSHGPVTCGAFSPDGSFVVTGTQDNRVLVWAMPSAEEVNKRLSAKVTLVERSQDAGSRQVRVRAELDEVPAWLVPGGSAKMIILPEAR
jgi:WD40 repeat protein/biotin carboxyl carrier protein